MALVALSAPELARFDAIIRLQGGIAVAVDDVAAALAAPLAADLVVVPSRLITRDTTRAIWRTRVERPGLGIVLLSNGGLADEMAGISVGTRVLLSPTLDDAQTEALLRSALGLGKSS